MTVTPEEIAQIRAIARQRRRLTQTEQRRRELAPYIDVGMRSDEDIDELWLAFKGEADPIRTVQPFPAP